MPVAERLDGAPQNPPPQREVRCAHCDLPVPPGWIEEGDAPSFCCAGCRAVYAILHDRGLAGYYRLERRHAAVASTERSFEELDDPAFQKLYARTREDGSREIELRLEGIHCASCVWLVERSPRLVPGLIRAELDAPRALVRIAWAPDQVSLSQIARALDGLGYRPHPHRGARADAERRAVDRSLLVRLGVAGALAGNVMLASLALYSDAFGDMAAAEARYFRWLCMLLAAPALIWPGRVFFRSAWAALRARTLHIDVPIALALAAGFTRGAVNTVTGDGPIYFDGVTMLVFLLLVARFLQQRAQRAAADAAELMHALTPSTARVIDPDGRARTVAAEALLEDAVCELRAGETAPADGEIVEGHGALDLSLLTGESRPVPARPGDTVWAGTVARGGTLRIRITRIGEESRLGRLLHAVEESARRRAPVVRFADRIAGLFVAAVLGLAAVTLLIWWARDPSAAVDHAIALLIVTCPCALALATPLAITVAIGRAARAGILIKGGDALERLARPGLLILDKTGTVTEGRTRLVRWDGTDDLRPLVLGLERHASHPLAEGFREAWPDVEPADARDVTSTHGGGLEGTVGERRVVVGSPPFVRARIGSDADLPPRVGSAPAAYDRDAAHHTPVWVAVDGRVVARAGFGDRIRDDAAATLDTLRRIGWRTQLLSGDDPDVTAAVGRRTGFDAAACRGGASPEVKQQVVADAADAGTAVMVGDGVNDAAAIARATVGVGVRGGAEACLSAADVFLSHPGLAPLVALFEGARRTFRVIQRGIAFSLLYNVAAASLAMAGLITPLLAAILMPASSLTVVLAARLSRTFEARP